MRGKNREGGPSALLSPVPAEPLWSRALPVFVFGPLGAFNAPHSSSGSVTLARLAAHLSEVRTAAELELEHQRTVGHFVYVFAFCRE